MPCEVDSGLRRLSDGEHRRYTRRAAAMKAAWLSGRDPRSLFEFLAAMNAYRASLGRPISDATVRRAIREHGHLGLRALDVAAEWTLAATRRPSPRGLARAARRPHRRQSRSSRGSPSREPDEPEPPLGRRQVTGAFA